MSFSLDADGRGGLGAVVLHEELEPAPQESAPVVRVLDAELVAAELVLARGGVGG
jgi:hypothetical protein